MSERKVLNKYYPPDFDPNKIPKLKRSRNRQFNIRIMAPFNMRCGTCGEYIYKGKKFNSRQEKVEDEDYLGLMIFRFYIKCPRCVSEISFKTDPKNTDYELEAGATRNFEALRTAEKLAEQEIKEKEDEEKNNPMKVLENRTKSSRQEMEMIETLEELRELNSRHAKVDHNNMIALHKAYEEQLKKLQDDEDEELIRSVFGSSSGGDSVRRIQDFEDEDDDDCSSGSSTPKVPRLTKPSDILTQDVRGAEDVEDTAHTELSATIFTKPRQAPKHPAVWQKSIGSINTKKSLLGIVKKKQTPATSTSSTTGSKPTESLTVSAPIQSMAAPTSETNRLSSRTVSQGSSETVGVNSTCAIVQSSDKSSRIEENGTVDTTERTSMAPANTGLGLLGAYSDTDSDT